MKKKMLFLLILCSILFSSCDFTLKRKSDINKDREIYFELLETHIDLYIWNYNYDGVDSVLEKQIQLDDCLAIYATDNSDGLISGYYKDETEQIFKIVNHHQLIDNINNDNCHILSKKFERPFQDKIEYYGNIYILYQKQ